MGGNVTVRAGTQLVQFVAYDNDGKMMVDDPHVYTLEPGGQLRWLKTAEIASSLYGTAWEQKIIPVSNYLYGNYALGAAIETAAYPTGAIVKETSSNNVYYIDNGQRRLISTNGLSSNRFQQKHYLTASSLSGYEQTGALNDYQNSISWTGGK